MTKSKLYELKELDCAIDALKQVKEKLNYQLNTDEEYELRLYNNHGNAVITMNLKDGLLGDIVGRLRQTVDAQLESAERIFNEA